MTDSDGGVLQGLEVLGIRECTRCGKTGEPEEEYGVRGIARIGGNICVECVREVTESAEVNNFE
jgi:hypothetical protein